MNEQSPHTHANNQNQEKSVYCTTFVYKSVNTTQLTLNVYQKPLQTFEHNALRIGIVFFFGGGWRVGRINQFAPFCESFAQQGYVCITVDYRVFTRHQSTPIDSLLDAYDAMKWIRTHANELHIDAQRIVASGGSAGAHLALSLAILDMPKIAQIQHEIEQHHTVYHDERTPQVNVKPDLLVLYNPVVDTTIASGYTNECSLQISRYLHDISPYHQLNSYVPDSLIFHGTDDQIVPFASVAAFRQKMLKFNNRCEVIPFDGQSHGFFNHEPYQSITIKQMAAYLIEKNFMT